MSFTTALSFGGLNSATSMGGTRGRINGAFGNGVNYPSPFFDIAHTYLPTNFKQLFRYCRYYFLTNPLINATVFKLSEYPITDIIIDHQDERVRRRWEEYFHDHLRYRAFQVETGLDYHTYGNCGVSISFPFHKYLKCQGCDWCERADRTRPYWVFTNFEFRLTCPRCGTTAPALVDDHYYPDAGGVRPIRWNVEDIEVTYNDITGKHTYFYNIPAPLQSDIVIGKKDVVEGIPQIFIQALKQRKGIVFSKDNFYHLRRPTLGQQDRGWGIPLLLPVLKDTFHLQLMKKAQEAIILEHVIPLRVVFPQAASGTSDPFCVSPSTLVETLRGLLPAEEIREGDHLRSHLGNWRSVEGIKRRPVGQDERVYKVTAASLSAFPFEVSEEHPILAVRKTSKKRARQVWVDPEFIPVQELKVGDYVAYPTHREVKVNAVLDLKDYLSKRSHTDTFTYLKLSQGAAEIYEHLEARGFTTMQRGERASLLEERGWSLSDYQTAMAMKGHTVSRIPRYMPVSEELATLVGYYLAEGSYRSSLVSLAFHRDEIDLHGDVDRCVRALGGLKGTRVYPGSVGDGVDVVIESVLISELLVGLCGKGFATKRIPKELSEARSELVVSMLRALFAGDGCDFVTEQTDRVALKLANPSLILEARRLLLCLGVLGCVYAEPPTATSKHKTTAYHLNYNGSSAAALRALFAGKAVPPQDARNGVFYQGYVLLPIRGLIAVDHVPEVIGFQMATDKSFCVAGVATHNTTMNLSLWKEQVAAEIARWRYDQNYIPIMPIPLGQQSIGGDGRALLMYQEMQMQADQIIMGMGVVKEFLAGGLSYSGTNVSMRILENAFIGYIGHQLNMARWIMKMVANYLHWPEANIRFKPFKMADDIQRKAYLFQLNQAGKVSDTTLLVDADLDQAEENEIMANEADKRIEGQKKQQIAMAEIQGESQLIMMKYQAKAQQAMMAESGGAAPGEPGGMGGGISPEMAGGIPQEAGSQLSGDQRLPTGPEGQAGSTVGGDIISLAQGYAQQLSQLPPDQQQQALQAIATQSPELAQLVQQMLGAQQQGQPQAQQVDMRPLPEQRPPRRAAGIV